MLNDQPLLLNQPIDVSESGLDRGAIFEGKGVDSGVDGQVSKNADVGFVNLSGWSFRQEINEVVFDFLVIMADLVRNSWKQNGIGRIECRDLFWVSGLKGVVPFLE